MNVLFSCRHTLFTICSFKTSWTLTCISTSTWTNANTIIFTWLSSTTIDIFASLSTISRWTLTCKTSDVIWYTLTTIQTWVWCTYISLKNTIKFVTFSVVIENLQLSSTNLTCFTTWTCITRRAHALISNISIGTLTCTTVHAWLRKARIT